MNNINRRKKTPTTNLNKHFMTSDKVYFFNLELLCFTQNFQNNNKRIQIKIY